MATECRYTSTALVVACRSRDPGFDSRLGQVEIFSLHDKCIICITIFNSVPSFQNSVDTDQLGSVFIHTMRNPY